MSAGFCQCKIRGCFSPAFTSQFFETFAAFELGKVLQPTAVGSSRSHLCKTVWQRAKSFLALFFPFICWSRNDMGLVTWALQVLRCGCPGRPAASRTPLSPGPAWQRCQWPPVVVTGNQTSRAGSQPPGLLLSGGGWSWTGPGGLILAIGERGTASRGISGLKHFKLSPVGSSNSGGWYPQQDPVPVP